MCKLGIQRVRLVSPLLFTTVWPGRAPLCLSVPPFPSWEMESVIPTPYSAHMDSRRAREITSVWGLVEGSSRSTAVLFSGSHWAAAMKLQGRTNLSKALETRPRNAVGKLCFSTSIGFQVTG